MAEIIYPRIWTLPTRLIGRSVEEHDSIDSTNSRALELAQNSANDGQVILAHEQSAGRGQYGRTWSAPSRSSVLLSVLLFPPAALRRPVIFTSWAAVAVGDLIFDLVGLQAKIKWPNDVLLHGKKVCGILIEQRTTGLPDHPLATIVGIGLNVSQSGENFQAANLPEAGSLLSLTGRSLDYSEVAEGLIRRLDDDYQELLEGQYQTLESQWIWRLGLLGRNVEVELADRRVQGRLLDLTFEGLLLEKDGCFERIAPEQVRHVTERTWPT